MMDFLFSFDRSREPELAEALARFGPRNRSFQRSYSGGWGVLVTAGMAYPGFETIETDRHIIVVLGGPLPRNDVSIAAGNESDDGTRWILNSWKTHGRVLWSEELVGSFLVFCVDKHDACADVVTDINAFIPAYISDGMDRILGSHSDAVALASGCAYDIDPVSVADFLTFSTVTYPYTMYKAVKYMPPASVTSVSAAGEKRSVVYWRPVERGGFGNISDAADELRAIITANIKRICAGHKRIGLLLSGGEDSRIVAAMIPEQTCAGAVTITDSYNREARIAQAVCRSSGVDWDLLTRTPAHYINHAEESIRLSESHNFFTHAHINGFADHLPSGCRIMGALGADAFCKGVRSKGKPFPFLKIYTRSNDWKFGMVDSGISCMDSVLLRREYFNDDLKAMRPGSWAEWHNLYPACMTAGLSHGIVNRRLFPAYEPFLDGMVVNFSASVPQGWKLNRRLFHRAMRPVLKDTWRIPHGEGWFPYYGNWLNLPVNISNRIIKKIRKKASWKARRNEGSWPIWDNVVADPAYERIRPDEASLESRMLQMGENEALSGILKACEGNRSSNFKLRSLQIELWIMSLDCQKTVKS